MSPGERDLREVAALAVPDALARLGTRLTGLDDAQVALRRKRDGPNTVSTRRHLSWPAYLWRAVNSPFNYILGVIALLSWITGDRQVVFVIAGMVLLSVLLSFVQELRGGNAAAALRAMVRTHATVVRTETPASGREIPIDELVVGDIVRLAAGDLLPADLRIISAIDLFVNQSTITGESMPVEKVAAVDGTAAASVSDLQDIALMGTSVVSGSATGVIAATGGRTLFGAIAAAVSAQEPMTAFDIGIRRISWLLVRFMVVMVPLVFVLNGVTKGNWLEAFLFGLAVAVGLAPEMLPTIVATNLARGAVAMSRRKTIVKRLGAIQNLGAMDILCTDKTGTLTQNRVILERYLDAGGVADRRVLELAYLVSANQTGLRNLLDEAVLAYAGQFAPSDGTRSVETKVDEVPFDFARRRMSVVLRGAEGTTRLITKGAVEEVLAACTGVATAAGVIPMDAGVLERARQVARDENANGMRVVAVASKTCAAVARWTAADERELVLAGFVCFLDPPKETAEHAITELHRLGVEVRVLTGDNELVSRAVCRQVGLDPGTILLGADLDPLDDAALDNRVARVTVFARLTPDQKGRVVRSLRRIGHTVGYLGDGINDAGALREADVGISVDSAADIARESADIILLEKDLLVLAAGVTEGRRIFANIMKYLKMTASSNFGNVFSVVAAGVLLPFLPMMPVQLLAQNLLYDVSQITIPWDSVDADYLAKPQRWNADDIGRFMLRIGPISSLFDLLAFGALWYLFGANSVASQRVFQTGWFIVGLVTQTIVVHVIRTSHRPLIDSRASLPLVAGTLTVIAAGMILPLTPLGPLLGFVRPVGSFYLFAVACAVAYVLAVQWVKRWYIARYHAWL